MVAAIEPLPDDVKSLKRLLAVRDGEIAGERAARLAAEAEVARATAMVSSAEALIAHLRLAIEKMKRELYGARSERGRKLLDQMELELEELEATAAQDETAAAMTVGNGATTIVPAHARRRPVRKPLPDHLPRERIVIPGPTACTCCGSTRLSKLGEDITETLEVIPRQWKVIQHVREKFTCRACEKISQTPAPPEFIEGPCDRARPGGTEPAGDDPLCQVRPAPAAQPAE